MKLTMQTESEFENNGGFDYHPFNINLYYGTMELTENVLKECK